MKYIAIAICSALAACSSVSTMDGREVGPGPAVSCDVTVYPTYQSAIARGPIEEMCVISGTSSMSLTHTVATAVAKHKSKACACGANSVYIQSRTESGLDLATVTMIAFRYRK